MAATSHSSKASTCVLCALSGGVDSSVAAVLLHKAIGDQLFCIHIDTGVMRRGESAQVIKTFRDKYHIALDFVDGSKTFLERLRGVTDPEQKRKIVGKTFIDFFEEEAKKVEGASFLAQGTLYPDVIESTSFKGPSATIKTHHNVGGLPKNMKFKLLEPLRYFYTDQVREIGLKLKLPHDAVYQQPFPGPGHAVRIVGEVTKERLAQEVQADGIVVSELRKSGWYKKVFQCWSVMTGTNSTAVKGDGRFYGEVVAVRIVNSKDRMTAEISRVPFPILEKIASRIVNEVPNVSRVVYDITSKPPATMEWE